MKRFFIFISTVALLTSLTACSAGTSSNTPKQLSETITQLSDSLAMVNSNEDETKRFLDITNIAVEPAINPDNNQIGLELTVSSNSSNIETTDWSILFKTVVSVLGTNPQSYVYDVAIPQAIPSPDPSSTTLPSPTPIVGVAPGNQDISFITITGLRNGGSGEEIKVCDTSGFQQSKLECKTIDPNSPYRQQIDWNWIKENYR